MGKEGLIFDDYSEDKSSHSENMRLLKSLHDLCVDNPYSKISEDIISQWDSDFK